MVTKKDHQLESLDFFEACGVESDFQTLDEMSADVLVDELGVK